jgi:short-subunit dehydrogenase
MQKNIVITGGTRGIGFGLAREFLKNGCSVTISGRKQSDVDAAGEKLKAITTSELIRGIACNVTAPGQVEDLWKVAFSSFGYVHIWVNNAGISHRQAPYWDLATDEVEKVVATNIIGLMNGTTTAVKGMIQQGFGAIYNMEGLGSNGMKINGLSVYGTTKSAVRYFTEALRKELKGQPVLIGELLPGMVITDMITGQQRGGTEELARNKKVYNILANRETDVTPWLVRKMLANTKPNASLKYVSTARMMGQLFSALFLKRDLFKEVNK